MSLLLPAPVRVLGMALELGRAVEIHGAVQAGELGALRAAPTTAPRAAAVVAGGSHDGRVKGFHRLNVKKNILEMDAWK
jgi:hypothetical protein